MANIDKLTVVSTDGASHLPKQLAGNLSRLIDMVSATTSLDVAGLRSGRAEATNEIPVADGATRQD